MKQIEITVRLKNSMKDSIEILEKQIKKESN